MKEEWGEGEREREEWVDISSLQNHACRAEKRKKLIPEETPRIFHTAGLTGECKTLALEIIVIKQLYSWRLRIIRNLFGFFIAG